MTQAKASATASTWGKPAPKAGTGAGVIGDAMLGPLTLILKYMGHAKMGESGLVSAITRKRVPAVREFFAAAQQHSANIGRWLSCLREMEARIALLERSPPPLAPHSSVMVIACAH